MIIQDVIELLAEGGISLEEAAGRLLDEGMYQGLAMANQKVAKRQRSNPDLTSTEVFRKRDEDSLSSRIDALGKMPPTTTTLTGSPGLVRRKELKAAAKEAVGGRLGRLGRQAKSASFSGMLKHPQHLQSAAREALRSEPGGLQRFGSFLRNTFDVEQPFKLPILGKLKRTAKTGVGPSTRGLSSLRALSGEQAWASLGSGASQLLKSGPTAVANQLPATPARKLLAARVFVPSPAGPLGVTPKHGAALLRLGGQVALSKKKVKA